MASAALLADMSELAYQEVHPIFTELVAATPDAFVQTIVDVIVPQTVFGRVMLLGDAAFVVRPHTAGATAKAAYDSRVLGRSSKRPKACNSTTVTISRATGSPSATDGRAHDRRGTLRHDRQRSSGAG